jgi:hypothetical protein
MFDIYFLVSLFFFALFCFFEIIVFNEEILLALCFFSFIFFCFNSIGSSVFESFQSRASKFEEELLVSYEISKKSINNKFGLYLASRNQVFFLKTLNFHITQYINLFSFTRVQFSEFLACSLTKLSELVFFKKMLVLNSQEKIVSLILYPLVFQLSKSNSMFLKSSSVSLPIQSTKSAFLSLVSK